MSAGFDLSISMEAHEKSNVFAYFYFQLNCVSNLFSLERPPSLEKLLKRYPIFLFLKLFFSTKREWVSLVAFPVRSNSPIIPRIHDADDEYFTSW